MTRMSNYTNACALLLALAVCLSKPCHSQDRKSSGYGAKSGLEITVQVMPTVRTPDSKADQVGRAGAGLTYDIPIRQPELVMMEDIVTMTDDSGHKYPVRRITVVAK